MYVLIVYPKLQYAYIYTRFAYGALRRRGVEQSEVRSSEAMPHATPHSTQASCYRKSKVKFEAVKRRRIQRKPDAFNESLVLSKKQSEVRSSEATTHSTKTRRIQRKPRVVEKQNEVRSSEATPHSTKTRRIQRKPRVFEKTKSNSK